MNTWISRKLRVNSLKRIKNCSKTENVFIEKQQEEKDKRQRTIGGFDDHIVQINNAESRVERAELTLIK